MTAAVEAFAERKFGSGGPFNAGTPGAVDATARASGAAPRCTTPQFKACVALQAQYVLDTFGKFPGTVPTLFILNYVQAHHLDLEFYDRFFEAGRLPAHRTPTTCSGGTPERRPGMGAHVRRQRPGHLDGAGGRGTRRPPDRGRRRHRSRSWQYQLDGLADRYRLTAFDNRGRRPDADAGRNP